MRTIPRAALETSLSRRRIVAGLALLGAASALGVLAACGTTAESPTAPPAAKPAATQPSAPAAGSAAGAAASPTAAPATASTGQVKLNHLTWLASPQKERYDELLKEYQQSHQSVQIEHQTVPGTGAATYPDVIKTGMAAGSPPDLFFMWGGSIAAPFIDAGGILPMEPYYQKYNWDKLFYPWTIESIKRKGKLWGAPKAGNGMGFWYRKDLFAKAGVGEARTYADVEANNAKLKASGVSPISIGGKYGWNTMRLLDYLLEYTSGPDLHDKLQHLQESWDRPEVVGAYKLLKKWVTEKWILPDFLTVAPNDALLPWYKGDAAMTFQTSATEATIKTADQDVQQYDFYLPPTEKTPMRMSGYPHQLMVARASKGLDAAADMINWMSQPAIQSKYFTALGATATVGAEPDPKTWPLSAKWAKTLESVKVYPPNDQAFYKELMDGYFEVQDGIVAGQISPEDGAKKMQEKATAWQKQSGKATTLD